MKGRAAPALTAEQKVLVEQARPTARRIARAMARRCPGLPLDEIGSITEATLTAEVLRYDPSRGASLAQFAFKAMVGAVLRAARKQESEPLRAARRAGLVHAESLSDERDLAAEIAATDQDRLRRSRALGEDFAAAMFFAYTGKHPLSNVEDAFIAREAMLKLREVYAALDSEDATLLDLLYWQELDWETTAARLGVSVSSAQRRQWKLLPRLRAALEARGIRGAPRQGA